MIPVSTVLGLLAADLARESKVGMTAESARATVDDPQEAIPGGKLDRAAAEKAAAIADGERRRDATMDAWSDYALLYWIRKTARDVSAKTGIELTEAAKTTACHAILAEILRRTP